MRFFKFFLLIFLAAFFSCKKNSPSFDTTPNFYIVNGGTASFANNLILFPAADTVTYNLVISSTFLPSKSVTVTLAVADEYRTSYNSSYGTNFQAMPSNAYSFQPTFTAGTTYVYDTIPVTLNKKFLSSGNFMLPIKISSVSDFKIDTSSFVIYLHTENNKLSGIYNSAVTKILYNGDAVDGNINSTDTFTLVKNLVPEDDNKSQLDYADLGVNGWKYTLGFSTDDNAFFAVPNNVIDSSIQAGSFQVITATFDSTNKNIYIKTSYKNLSGDERIVEESLTLQ